MRERLEAVVGREGVRTGGEVGRWAVHGVAPRAVAAPATAQEAAALLALASEQGWIVELAGAGGWLDCGRAPARIDLLVATERIASRVDHEPDDLVATVDAGVPLGVLGERLAPRRQWLPLDPPALAGATLGAVIALGGAGPLRERYGTPRDHALGLRLVTGDGRILDLGGRVVKNVAGYDLVKLVVGSRGTLGLVTHVHLRLRPLPERDVTLIIAAAGHGPLVELVGRLREERVPAAALELASAPAGATGAGWALLVRLLGGAEAVEAGEDRVRRLAGAASLETVRHDGRGPDPWARLGALEAGAALSVRLADRPARLSATLERALALPGAGSAAALVAHAGAGIVRVNVPAEPEHAAVDVERWGAALPEARAALAEHGGTLHLANAPARLLERVEPWGDPDPALRVMRALRKEFDPAGILAPGRFVL